VAKRSVNPIVSIAGGMRAGMTIVSLAITILEPKNEANLFITVVSWNKSQNRARLNLFLTDRSSKL
jgi:hypothetical protein